MHKFQIGDIINSSISSPQEIIDIRIGTEDDFKERGKYWIGEMCYVLRFVYGKRGTVVYSVAAVDKDCHLKGTEMYEAYEATRREYFAEIGKPYEVVF